MPGKIITIRESEFGVLSQAKKGYEQAQGKETDWGNFLLFLLGLWLLNEVMKEKKGAKIRSGEKNKTRI
jgi:hypothetical protein